MISLATVYAALFSNLIAATTSSVADVIVFPFIKSISYDVLGTASSSVSLMHHCNCWQVLSVLRYVYIVRPDLVERYFPDQTNLTLITILTIASLTLISACFQLVPLVASGWPYVKLIMLPTSRDQYYETFLPKLNLN